MKYKYVKKKILIWLCLTEYFLEDSDLEGLSDITVSSVHTSDLSSLEGQSEDDQQQSDSSEEGELPPDGINCSQFLMRQRSSSTTDVHILAMRLSVCVFFFPFIDEDEKEKQGGDAGEEHKPRRKAYVHKPFLYSRYYSDSDDEVTVEERRRSAVGE